MGSKLKKRIMSIVCIICVLGTACFNRISAWAEDTNPDEVITLATAPEKDFESWTFSDVGIPDSSFGTYWDPNTSYTTGKSLDKTIFQGKIDFPTNGSGHFYIGDVDPDGGSLWRGFRFLGNGTEKLDFAFVGSGGTTVSLATFEPAKAGTTLRGNKDLKVAVSVEYTSVTAGKVTMKVGVFFDEKLYDNTYYTVQDVPEEFLTQTIRFSNPGSGVKWTVASINITLETAPEKDFALWTFSDVGIPDSSFGTYWDPNTSYTTGKSLDKTIFQGKINFPTNGSGHFYIGDVDPDGGSLWRGFRFTSNGTDKLDFAFVGSGGTTISLATFEPAKAGTTLRGNNDLEVAVSVEYTSVTAGNVTMKVGVFFDGRLYNNKYFTVQDVPEAFLTQTIRFSNPGSGVKWTVASIITLDSAPEGKFAHWSFSDVRIPDSSFGTYWDPNTSYTTGKSLDKTIFQGKIDFPTNGSGHFYIGDVDPDGGSLWRGFRFLGNGTEKLDLAFVGSGGTTVSLATFEPAKAGTTLRGNKDLKVAVSVEYTSVTAGKVTMKVGVFFDEKLYNSTYYTVQDVPEEFLTQTIRFSNPGSGVKWTVASINITLDTAPESKFPSWTFSEVGIQDGSYGNFWSQDTPYTNGKSLDKTIFQGKIDFPANGFGHFYIGDVDPDSGSLWRGFRFTNNGTDKLDFAFVGTDGYYYNENGSTGSTAVAGLLATFDPTIAGTTLRGNKDLKVGFSVEYTSVEAGLVTMKVGVFFDGKLYNNSYYTIKDVPEAFLTQTIRCSGHSDPANNKLTVASLYKEGTDTERITLETAPEKDFACWTFSDCRIKDQTLTSNLNWEDDFKDQTVGTSLDKTIFNGKVNFSTDSTHFGNFYIGGASANDASKWRGFVFLGDGTTGLRLLFQGAGGKLYNANGNTGSDNTGTNANVIAVFNPVTAGTTLRGNSALRLSFSVEYVETTDTAATLKVGVFFDGNLYDNTYYTVKDVPIDYLNQNVRFNIGSIQTNAVASQHMEQCEAVEAERITLDNAPEKDFSCWTFSDAGLDDQQLYGNLNWGDAYKNYTIGASLDKTIFNGKIKFASGTTNFGNFYIGGASANDASKWRGFVFLANGTEGLKLCFMGSNGLLYNANGNTQGDNTNNLNYAIATFNSNNAGTTLRGNKDLQVSLSVEYMETTNTTANLKVGVFFDGVLYNNTYYTVKDVPLEYLNQNVRFYVTGEENEIASHHLCGKVDVKTEIKVHSTYEELTLHDFSIYDTKVEKFAEGAKEFRLENYYDKASLDGIAFSAICNFPKKSEARFSLGGSFWRGVYFRSLNDGRIEVSYVDKAGDARTITRISADKAGTDAVLGKDITLRITFDITETGNGKADMRVGIYVNGKLYEGKHYIVRNIDTETMTRTMKLYVTEVPFEIKSVPITIDLSIYGFDNKTWKDKI